MVEEVEGLLAGARHPRDGVAVSQGEAKLHVNLLGSLSGDPIGAKPVVLVGLHHVANLESVDGTVVLIHLRDGIPLNRKKLGDGGRRGKKREKQGGDESMKVLKCLSSPSRQQCKL